MTRYTAAYAYPTSPNADTLHRHFDGCWYVQKTVGHEPGTIFAGPYETKPTAEGWAKLFQTAWS